MIHRFQGGQENQGNLVALEYQDHHFSQEYQEGPKKSEKRINKTVRSPSDSESLSNGNFSAL